jgi:hypothetical protein
VPAGHRPLLSRVVVRPATKAAIKDPERSKMFRNDVAMPFVAAPDAHATKGLHENHVFH